MDKHHSYSAAHPGDEHEVDFSIRGIVVFGVCLAVGIALTFVACKGIVWGLEKWEHSQEAAASPVEKQLRAERAYAPEAPARTSGSKEAEIKPSPEEEERIETEQALQKTFPTPRLQYDDVQEMNFFLTSENKWLNSNGKNPDGTAHIPISQAMDLLAARGLPSVNGKFSPDAPGAVPTGNSRESSHQPKSGRGLTGDTAH